MTSSFGSQDKVSAGTNVTRGTRGRDDDGAVDKGKGLITEESTRSSLHVGDARAGREDGDSATMEDGGDGDRKRKKLLSEAEAGSKGVKGGKRKSSKERNTPAATETALGLGESAVDDATQSLLTVPPQATRPPSPDGEKPPTIRASVAVADVDGSLRTDDSFVFVRPHPYQRCDDDGRPRTFVYKNRLFEVPLLPLHELDEDRQDPDKGLSKGTGWQVVKSKVVGQKVPAG